MHASNTGDISTLLLFDTPAGGNLIIPWNPPQYQSSCQVIKGDWRHKEKPGGRERRHEECVFIPGSQWFLSTAHWTVRNRDGLREWFYLQPRRFLRGKPTERRVDSNNRTLLGCYSSVSRVLLTWMSPLCFHQCHQITCISGVSHTPVPLCLLSHIWQDWMYGNN